MKENVMGRIILREAMKTAIKEANRLHAKFELFMQAVGRQPPPGARRSRPRSRRNSSRAPSSRQENPLFRRRFCPWAANNTDRVAGAGRAAEHPRGTSRAHRPPYSRNS
jgi:hypothetical protein